MKGQRLVAHVDKSFVIIRDITCIFIHEPLSLRNGEGSVNTVHDILNAKKGDGTLSRLPILLWEKSLGG